MIDAFIAVNLASIDDLAELKVTLVALRLMEQRNSATAHVTFIELATHPALHDGLGAFARLSLEMALRKAIARGTLLASSEDFATARFFANSAPARALIEQLAATASGPTLNRSDSAEAMLRALVSVIERLEGVEVYAQQPDDAARVQEWLARGYTQQELLTAVQTAYRPFRSAGAPARALKHAEAQVFAKPPAQPSTYYAQFIAAKGSPHRQRPSDEAIAFRELNGRPPTGSEFGVLQAATGLFGGASTVAALQRAQGRTDTLLAILAEQQEAEHALARRQTDETLVLKQVVSLFQSTLGGTVGGAVADEMRHMLADQPDLAIWKAAFEKAASENKKNWAYVRAVVRNPSPNLLLPPPVNAAAKHGFELYRKRAGRGLLDPFVAGEINALAATVSDVAKWDAAFDEAAAQNALNWNYLKAVLTGTGSKTDGKRHEKTARGRKAQAHGQREQVSYTDEERAAKEQAISEADVEARLAAMATRRKRLKPG